jgi:hypothetical protein
VLGVAVLGAIVTRIVTRDLGTFLKTTKASAEIKTSILAQVGGGNFSISSADPKLRPYSDALSGPLKESFVSGMRLAFVVAGVILLLGAASVAVLARNSISQTESLADEGISEEAEAERALVQSAE